MSGGGNSGASVVILEMFERLFGTGVLVPWEPCGLHVLYHKIDEDWGIRFHEDAKAGTLSQSMPLQADWLFQCKFH